jgi:hypothetical protein
MPLLASPQLPRLLLLPVKKCPHSLNQDQFDSAILRATIGCFISSDEMRCPESASHQAI